MLHGLITNSTVIFVAGYSWYCETFHIHYTLNQDILANENFGMKLVCLEMYIMWLKCIELEFLLPKKFKD